MKPTTKDAYQLVHEGALALAEAEAAGMRVDTDLLEHTIRSVSSDIDELERTLKSDSIWNVWKRRWGDKTNLDSRHQIAVVLFNELDMKHSGKMKADEAALEATGHPFATDYLQLQKLKKLRSTYLMGVKRETVDGFVHFFFNLHLVKSLRSSCDTPNIQNIPIHMKDIARLIRSCFVPRDDHVLVEVDFGSHEWKIASCVVGETLVETIDGPQSIKDVCDRVSCGDRVFVYGYDNDKNRIGVSRVVEGGITRSGADVWKLTLDNGESVTATLDHKFMTRDGYYKELGELKVGDSLMPFYSRNRRSSWGTVYTEVDLNNGKTMRAHNLIARDVFGFAIGSSGFVVHHWDGNGTNNSLDNIDVLTRKLHMSIHSKQGWRDSPPSRKENAVKRAKSDKFKEHMRHLMAKRKEEWGELRWNEWKKKIRDTTLSRKCHVGAKNGMFGRKHSKATRAAMSQQRRGRKTNRPAWSRGQTKHTNESLMKVSKALQGRTPYNKGVRTMAYLLCKECGEVFECRLCEAKRRSFCSVSCAITRRNRERGNPWTGKKSWCAGIRWHRSTGKPKQKVTRVCGVCGDQFEVYEGNSKKFCSGSCRGKNMNQKLKERRNHKVVSIERAGVDDVYNITVDKFHNYVVSSGVVVKNCFWSDESMIAYASDLSLDIHRDIADQVYMLGGSVPKPCRQVAKGSFVFPELYGSYYISCAKDLWNEIDSMSLTTVNGDGMKDHLLDCGIDRLGSLDPRETPEEGTFVKHIKDIESDFNERFPQWSERKHKWWNRYQKRGWFRLMTGFVCSGVYSRNNLYNYPVQGPAFHLLLWSFIQMVKWQRKNKMRSRIVAQIHDSIIGDVHKDELSDWLAKIKQVMTVDVRKHWDWVKVPLLVEADMSETNWWEKRNIKI